MFAPKVMKPRTKATADGTNNSACQHPAVRTRPLGSDVVEKKFMLQAPIGNQAMLRQLNTHLSNPHQNGHGKHRPTKMIKPNGEAPNQRWALSKVPGFAADRTSRQPPASLLDATPIPHIIQAKLPVGEVNDPLEHEADRVTEQVMSMPDLKRPVTDMPSPVIRKRAAFQEKAGTAQTHAARPSTGAPDGPSDRIEEVLHSSGQPLDAEARLFFEPRFGYDFSGVRVHLDGRAAKSAQTIGARAYTAGSNVVFGAEQYQPGSSQGRSLIAHELTHVVQQGGGTAPLMPRRPPVTAERERAEGRHPVSVSSLTDRRIQRFDSFEHVQLGDTAGGPVAGLIMLECHNRDLPQHAGPPTGWPADWQRYHATLTAEQRRALTSGLTYGEIVALSGDMYDSFQSLNRAPLREVIDLIPLIRGRATTTEQLQSATGGRYLALAKENIGHFSNVPMGQRNIDVWRRNHMDAIAAARSGNPNLAWGLNAAGDHFLTDAFSGGHLRVDRATLHAHGDTGQLQSKILHDLDNQFGVEVQNERGDPAWIAYGDDHLNDPANTRSRTLALEAVELSKRDIAEAMSQRTAYPTPTLTTVFAAERLIPHPVSMTRDRWTGRQSNPWMPGVPGSQDTDYQRERRSLAASEGASYVAELSQDDDHIRAWIGRMDVAALGRQSESDVVRMINVLLSGVVDAADMDAIERLLGSVTNVTEMDHLRAIFGPRAIELDFGMRTRLRVALARRP